MKSTDRILESLRWLDLKKAILDPHGENTKKLLEIFKANPGLSDEELYNLINESYGDDPSENSLK